MQQPRNFLDKFVIFPIEDLVPGGLAEGIIVLGEHAVRESVTAFKKPVVVMRITDDFPARNVTDEFVPEPEPECDDVENWARAHTRYMTRIGSFGRR